MSVPERETVFVDVQFFDHEGQSFASMTASMKGSLAPNVSITVGARVRPAALEALIVLIAGRARAELARLAADEIALADRAQAARARLAADEIARRGKEPTNG